MNKKAGRGEGKSKDKDIVMVILSCKMSRHSVWFMRHHWKSIKRCVKGLRPRTKFVVVKYKVLKSDSYNTRKYPHALTMWGWFMPTILLVPKGLWKEAQKDPTTILAVWRGVKAFNIINNPDCPKLPHYTGNYQLNSNGVLDWVTTVI